MKTHHVPSQSTDQARPVDLDEHAHKQTMAMRDDDIANIMRALGHPVRLEILRILAGQQGQCCCGDVTESLPLAQSTVSQHIKVLLDARLIERKAQGTRNRYCIRHDKLHELNSAFGGLLQGLAPLAAIKEAEPA